MLGRLIAMSLATQVLFAGHCAAQAVDPGPVRVGDRWSYNISDDLTGDIRQAVTLVVVETTEREITTRVSVKGKDRPQTMVFDHDWGRIDDGLFKLRPAGIGIRKPLQIDKEWRSDANAINLQTGHTFRASGAAKVAAQEHMKVPAGTFPAVLVTAEATSGPLRSKGKVWVWYSDDASHTPVQMRAKLGWGTLLFRLQRVEK